MRRCRRKSRTLRHEMMDLLLDTDVAIWWMEAERKQWPPMNADERG
jgi:hypothetical protein